jgi:Right handed beta helix region
MLKSILAACATLTFLTAAVSPVTAAPVSGGVVRAWVSGHGNDIAGCGAPANACRTLQYTHDSVVAAGGEIDILDPAGYGTLNITKAISIVNDGVGTAGVQAASGNGITINAGPTDAVRLKGLSIEGLGTANFGIIFNSGASLEVEDCEVRDFSHGLSFHPTGSASLLVADSRFTKDKFGTVEVIPTTTVSGSIVNATLQRVQLAASNEGLIVDSSEAASGTVTNVTLADSLLTDNVNYGVSLSGGSPITVTVRNSTLSNNGTGIDVGPATAGTVVVARSTFSGNAMAFERVGGTIESFGDNNVIGTLGSTPTSATFH